MSCPSTTIHGHLNPEANISARGFDLIIGLVKTGSFALLGLPVVPFYPFLGEGSPTKIDYGKKLVPLFKPLWRT